MNGDKGEERLERVLNVLGSAEADGGLEGRVLQRLAEARATGTRGGGWVRAAVVCGCVAVCGLAVWVGHERGGGRAEGGEEAISVYRARVEAPVERGGSPRRTVRQPRVQNVTADVAKHVKEDAESEMDAPSMAAPAAPLTAEERLLVRAARGRAVVSGGEAEEDAALAPERQTEVHALFAEFGRGLFAGMEEGAVE